MTTMRHGLLKDNIIRLGKDETRHISKAVQILKPFQVFLV